MKRRHFFNRSAAVGIILVSDWNAFLPDIAAFEDKANLSRKEASYYKKLPDREIECLLCPRLCRLGDRERGYCGTRENIDGTYYTLVYGKPCTINVDPIEKKPFFHFLPKTDAFSLATAGCNVNCKFCQNWEMSQVRPEQVHNIDLPPVSAVAYARKYDCRSIAYTYTEPVVFFEYMYDTSILARNQGIKNVVVTAGHINPEPLKDLLEVVDAVKVDLKAFSQDFYSNYVRGELKHVLESIKIISRSPIWLEIVYLVIPTLNDDEQIIRKMCRWLLAEVGPDVPVHFSRFHPMYLLKNLPPTPVSSLERIQQAAKEEGLHFVYVGNVPGHKFENTFCPRCGKKIIERIGYRISAIELKDGRCRFCNNPIPGIWA